GAAAAMLWTLSYRTSWGQTFHTENLLVLHLIVLAVSPAADAWAVASSGSAATERDAGYGWAIKLLAVVTVATYVPAGVAKLRLAGGAWLVGDQLRDQIAVDNLRKALAGESVGALAVPLLAHPAIFAAFAIATLAIELGAPVALLAFGARWRKVGY